MNAAQPIPRYAVPARPKHVQFKSEAEFAEHLAEMAKVENKAANLGKTGGVAPDNIPGGSDLPDKILAFVEANPGCLYVDAAKALGVVKATISTHAVRLDDAGVLIRKRDGGSTKPYRLWVAE